MIYAKKIVKSFKDNEVLKDINLSCAASEILTILGKNGAGKSTLLNILSGLIKPDSGFVYYDDTEVFSEYYKHKSKSGYLLDNPFYMDKLTATEFLMFMGKLYSIPSTTLKETIDKLCILFNVPQDKKHIEKYSKGTKQKLSFITAILNNPDYLILDEPFVNMDTDSINNAKEILFKLKSHGTHIIISTNQEAIIEDITDRKMVIENSNLSEVFSG